MKDKKTDLIIVIGTFCFYYILDMILKSDMLSAFTFHEGGFTISFIGIVLWLITSIFVKYVTTIKKNLD